MSKRLVLEKLLTGRIMAPGLDVPTCECLQWLEYELLVDPEVHLEAVERARTKGRMQMMTAFDPQHIQGLLRRVTISKPDGSVRETWSPTDADYSWSCYFHFGILRPMLKGLSNPGTHAYIPKRGTNTATSQLIATVSQYPEPYVIQTDIKNWFPTVPMKPVLNMLPPMTAQAALQTHLRYRQARGGGTSLQGLPQGHPLSAAIATLVFDRILTQTRSRFATNTAIIAYSDDVTIVARSERAAETAMAHMEAALNQHDVHLNHKKTRKIQPRREDTMDYLGYRIDWPGSGQKPRIRPSAKAYRRLAERLARSYGPTDITGVIRGWLNAYRLTNDPEAQRELDALMRSFRGIRTS